MPAQAAKLASFISGAGGLAAEGDPSTASRSARCPVSDVHVTAKRKRLAGSVRPPAEDGSLTPNLGSFDLFNESNMFGLRSPKPWKLGNQHNLLMR